MLLNTRTPLLAIACSIAGATSSLAQARPLQPADFVVADIPDNYPNIDIAADTIQIRRALGPPVTVRHHEFLPGDTMTTWEYDGLVVQFGSIARQSITLTTSRLATHRGLRVGDTQQRVVELYGPPSEREGDEWTYEDPRERLHAIIVTLHRGRVVRIYIGSIWD